jgi:hypothetical protein
VGLAVDGGGVVGIAIFVIRGEEVDVGGAAHEKRTTARSATTPRRVARADQARSVGVF